MIPKIIHCCWFGGADKPELVNFCQKSWRNILPDYRVVEWNEENFKYKAPFFEEALKRKRFAFASDYARAVVLRDMGGVYLDTDVEVRRSFNCYLEHKAFSGFEMKGYPFTAVWGSEPQHALATMVCKYYEDKKNYDEIINTRLISEMICEEFGINPENDNKQVGRDDLVIYPSSTFCVDLLEAAAVHHFNGSWLEERSNISYKRTVAIAYHANKIAELKGFNNKLTYEAIQESVGAYKHSISVASRPLREIIKKIRNTL